MKPLDCIELKLYILGSSDILLLFLYEFLPTRIFDVLIRTFSSKICMPNLDPTSCALKHDPKNASNCLLLSSIVENLQTDPAKSPSEKILIVLINLG